MFPVNTPSPSTTDQPIRDGNIWRRTLHGATRGRRGDTRKPIPSQTLESKERFRYNLARLVCSLYVVSMVSQSTILFEANQCALFVGAMIFGKTGLVQLNILQCLWNNPFICTHKKKYVESNLYSTHVLANRWRKHFSTTDSMREVVSGT